MTDPINPDQPTTMSMRGGGPDTPDDYCDVEYRGPHGKWTFADDVPDVVAAEVCKRVNVHEQLVEALKWLTNVNHNVGKSGNTPERGEYKAALDAAIAALDAAEGE